MRRCGRFDRLRADLRGRRQAPEHLDQLALVLVHSDHGGHLVRADSGQGRNITCIVSHDVERVAHGRVGRKGV
jgi:hypothetical protein